MASNNEQIKTLNDKLKQNQELIEAQGKQISEMLTFIERVGSAGLEPAIVTGFEGKYVILNNGRFAINPNSGLITGSSVLIYPKTGQVVESTPLLWGQGGSIVSVEKVQDNGTLLVRIGGEQRIVVQGFCMGYMGYADVEAGDKVLVDQHGVICLALIERAQKEQVAAPVYWDQIGGQAEAKRLLREAIEEPYLYPELYAAYGKGIAAGGLLWGPPGCGKTLLARAVATAIGDPKGFISVAGPELLNSFVGESEAGIRACFNRAEAFKGKTGKPAVIFIDEAEALLSTRNNPHNFMGQTVVPQFLTMMQGLKPSSAIVLLSTNRPDMIDPAIIREGRISFKVEIAKPDIVDAREIFNIHIGGRPIKEGSDREGIIDHAVIGLYAHEKLPHSGALIEGCVNKALTSALRRDLELTPKGKKHRVSGLCEEDFTWGIERLVEEAAAQKAA